MFVDNLPQSMTLEWLRQIFKHHGDLLDVFLSRRIRKKNTNLFGFVKYATLEEAKKVVEELNGVQNRTQQIYVGLAKYDRKGKNESTRRRTNGPSERRDIRLFMNQWDKRSYKDVVCEKMNGFQRNNHNSEHNKNTAIASKKHEPKTIVVQGVKEVENLVWLQREVSLEKG